MDDGLTITDHESPKLVSVIIPVRNGGEPFRHCLAALGRTTFPAWECIVVDDGSTDGSAELAKQFGAQVARLDQTPAGPAVARNLGAELAQGDLLFFLDADVQVYSDTIERLVANFESDPALAACFGSYDDAPASPSFLSQYKNLLHHYVHQQANEAATTFWAGCGAVQRDCFWQIGGFNPSYRRPSIEDIELGTRLLATGHKIHLDKGLQVKHFKQWTASSLLTTDIRDRAFPWSQLLLRQGRLPNDLNMETGQRLSGLAAVSGLLALLAASFHRPFAWLGLLAASLLLILNWPFYRFLVRKQGLGFMLMALPWHWLYFVYSSVSFGLALLAAPRALAAAFDPDAESDIIHDGMVLSSSTAEHAAVNRRVVGSSPT